MSAMHGEVRELLEGLKSNRDRCSYDIREINVVLPSITDRDAPVVQTGTAEIENVLGKLAEFVASPGTYDQKHIDRIGKLNNCIAYKPGIVELAHKPDEYVRVDDMINSARVMAAALQQILLYK